MELTFSQHARAQMAEREIPQLWVERVVTSPARRTPDQGDDTAEHFYAPVAEHGDRVLRVVVNTSLTPWRVVTVFFDRRARGER